MIIVGAGFLVEFLYFGLLRSKNDSYQVADTIFILNGDSERIKKGYEPEIRGRRTDVGGQKPEEGDRSAEGGNPKDVPVFRAIRSWVLFGV